MRQLISTLDSPHSALHRAVFVLVIFIGILLRVLAFQGYSDSDPRAYTILATDLSAGILRVPEYDGPPVFPLRIGVYGPTAILINALGLSESTLVAYPFFLSVAALLVAYGLGRVAFGPLAGLITAAVLAAVPLDIKMASMLFPDSVAAFWANLGVLLVWLSLFSITGSLRSRLAAFVGGFGFGISWLCKESVVYLVPFVLILFGFSFASKRVKQKGFLFLFVAIGALAVLFAETVFLYATTGDALWHFHATERNYQQCHVWFFDASSPYFGWEQGGHVAAIAKRLLVSGPRTIFSQFLALPALAAIALAWATIWKKRAFVIPGCWLVSLVFMFNFMSSSFQVYSPLPLLGRYLYPILLPSTVIFGGYIATLLRPTAESSTTKERMFWAFILCSFFCLLLVREGIGFFSRPEQVERTVAARLGQNDVVYTDYRTAKSLTFFRTGTLSRRNAVTVPYENVIAKDMKTGAYVLVDKKMTEFLRKSYKYRPPLWVDATPPTWLQVWSDGDAILYRIMDHGEQGDEGDAVNRVP